MKVSRFIFNPFGVNTYALWNPDTLEAIIVDPGMIDGDECNAIDEFIVRNNLRPVHLINTHMHLDHIFGSQHIKSKYNLKVEANDKDDFLGRTLDAQIRQFHLPIEAENQGVDVNLNNGDKIYLGKEYLEVITVPGHSPGSIALYCPTSKFVITGDALFRGSIGRTDLPGGNHEELMCSIRNKLMSLPIDTVILPGHGDESTIEHESKKNPYLYN